MDAPRSLLSPSSSNAMHAHGPRYTTLHNASAVGLKHIARIVACGLRARAMPVTRHVTYKFVDDTSGVVFQPPLSMVFEVGSDPWLTIPASNRCFAQFVGATKHRKGGGRAIHDHTSKSFSLSCHNGFAEIQRLRNEAHLRTCSDATDTKSAKAADGDKLAALFGKRPAEDTARPVDGETASDAAAPKVLAPKGGWNKTLHKKQWTHAKVDDGDWENRVMTVRLGDYELMTLRPNSANAPMCFPCTAASVSQVVDYLRARNHEGCFDPQGYQQSGKFVGRKRAKSADDVPSDQSVDAGDGGEDSAAQLAPDALE